MNITYHDSNSQSNSQWNDIIKQSEIDSNVPVYLIECRRPKQGFPYLSSWLQSELRFIPNEIKQQSNAREILIVFHIYDWVNIDYNECVKVFLSLNLDFVKVLVPVIPPDPGYLKPVCNWLHYFPSYWMGYQRIIKNSNNVKQVSLHKRNKKFTCLNRVPRPHRIYTV